MKGSPRNLGVRIERTEGAPLSPPAVDDTELESSSSWDASFVSREGVEGLDAEADDFVEPTWKMSFRLAIDLMRAMPGRLFRGISVVFVGSRLSVFFGVAVTQFHSDVVSRASNLQSLANSPVTDITVYHRPGVSEPSCSSLSFPDDAWLAWSCLVLTHRVSSPFLRPPDRIQLASTSIPQGPVTHDYLILCIRPSDPPAFGGLTRIWARCERNPGSIPGGAAKLSREPAPAVDTIKFSVERPKLRAQEDVAIMECAYDRLRVLHVADLLRVIHDVSPQ